MIQVLAKIWLNWLIRRHNGLTGKYDAASPMRSILFVELTKFGDVISIIPAMYAFHKSFSEASFSVAVQSQFAPIFRYLSFPVEIIPLRKNRTIGGFIESVIKIKKQQFDLAISMSPGIRNGILTLSTSSKAKIGYFEAIDTITPFLETTTVRGFGTVLKSEVHYSRENISIRAGNICTALGIPMHEKNEFLNTDNLEKTITKQLRVQRESIDNPIIVLHPFAGWKYREWKLANFLSLAHQLANERSARVVIIGLQEELKRIPNESIIEKSMQLFYSENVEELLALFKLTSLYIGNDSGPLHLASMMGIPCIGLYGPAPPHLTAPANDGNIYCYHKFECSPCDQKKCVHPENPCMDSITPDEVLRSIHGLLKLHAAAS
ncbi:MAG: glycosyltransferase family 9 protein [Bacteroidota bacterium]